MHLLYQNWKIRSLIITSFIVVTCVFFYLLDQSEWAIEMRNLEASKTGHGDQHEGDGPPNFIFGLLGSLLKQLGMIGVPMMLAIGIGKLYQKLSKTKA